MTDAGTGSEEIAGTFRAARRVAFAIWWKLSLVWAISQIAAGFVIGFVSYLVPFGQLQFWLAAQASRLFGEQTSERIYYVVANWKMNLFVLPLAVLAVNTAFLFVLMNWLLASHIGRTFGHFRLTLQRV